MTPTGQTKNGKIGRLCALLREDILRGRFKPGVQLPNPKRLGQKHGLAETSASVALSRLAHEGLVVRIPRRGSFVTDQVPAQHKVLDFVRVRGPAGTAERSYILSWIEGLSHLAEQQGWMPRWHHLFDEQAEQVEQLAERFADSRGVVFAWSVPPELPWIIWHRGIPVVALNPNPGGMGDAPACYAQVSYDRREAARLGSEHLVAQGRTRLALVGLNTSLIWNIGFMDVLRRHNLPVEGKWLIQMESSSGDFRLMESQVREILKDSNRPDGFCCATVGIASVIEAVAADLNLAVPDDLAVVAFSDGDPHIQGQPSVTVAGVLAEEICGQALDIIEQLGSQPKLTDHHLQPPLMIPPKLTVRDSCGATNRADQSQKSGVSNLAGKEVSIADS